MLKIGKHTCRVVAPINGWFTVASTGAECLRLPLEIIDGPCEGEQVDHVMWLSEKALPRTVKTLVEVFGWDRNLAALANLVNTGPFVGKECQITVENEEYNGKMYPKIKWLNRKGGGDGAPIAKESIAEFVARMSGKVLAVEIDGEAPPPTAKRAPRPPADPNLEIHPDDNIPF